VLSIELPSPRNAKHLVSKSRGGRGASLKTQKLKARFGHVLELAPSMTYYGSTLLLGLLYTVYALELSNIALPKDVNGHDVITGEAGVLNHGGTFFFYFNNWGTCSGRNCCDTKGGCSSCCMCGGGNDTDCVDSTRAQTSSISSRSVLSSSPTQVRSAGCSTAHT
jgi:hypothetical protein